MEEKRFDLLGNEVQVGDEVIIMEPHYKDYINGTILKFTPKGFRVKYQCPNFAHPTDTFVGSVIKGKIYEPNNNKMESENNA